MTLVKKSSKGENLEVNIVISRRISSTGCGEENENDTKNENNDFTKSMNEKKIPRQFDTKSGRI